MRQSLEIGPKTIDFNKYERAWITCGEEIGLYHVDANGVIAELALLVPRNKRMSLRFDQDLRIAVMASEGTPWALDIMEGVGIDPADPTPVELPEDAVKVETLEQRLKRHLHALVEDMYGRNSKEFESFEEANDLDWDNDGFVTPYEVQMLEEQQPVEKAGTEVSPKAENTEVTTEVKQEASPESPPA